MSDSRKTLVIQIGNSDNKLDQGAWSSFYEEILDMIEGMTDIIHFSAPSVGSAPWQNAAFIFEIDVGDKLDYILRSIPHFCQRYGQASIAVTIGESFLLTGSYKLNEIPKLRELRS